jgi:capsid protein
VGYPSASGDYSTSNYSSSRLERLDIQEYWRTLQQWLIRELLEPITRAWLRAAVSEGELILPRYDINPEAYEDAMNWVARGWEWIQPEVEVQAARDAVRRGFKTRAEVIMSRGGDYQETIQALAEEKEELDEGRLHICQAGDSWSVRGSAPWRVGISLRRSATMWRAERPSMRAE